MSAPVLDLKYNRSLFDVVPTAIVVAEPDTGRIIDANEAFLHLVRLSLDEVVGAEHPYPWRTDGNQAPADPGSVIERLYRRPDGSTVPVEVATHSLPSSGGPLLAGVVTDLSEKRRLEQQLIQSGKLAAIGELAAGVAHEINNPLLAILGLTEFLLLDSPEGTKERERLDLIQQTGLEIKEIVRALLDFARANPNESRVVDLEFVVRRTIDFVRRTNANKGIELVEHYGADGACVTAYGDQLEQVVLNLLANARQSMPNGGVITIDVRRDGDHVLVVISDEGPGVPSDLEDRIFDPFFTTRRSTGGTGLGLSVSLGIASAHGGTLTLASEPGRGAAFTLRLPLQPEPAS